MTPRKPTPASAILAACAILAGCASTTTPPRAATSPTHTAAAPAAHITQTTAYTCTGTAPDGIDITYGPDGTNLSASALPFTQSTPLDPNAQYYVVDAQLHGSGQVTCQTVVTYTDASGTAHSVTKSATASGGYNIASAQVCSRFDGAWEAC
jgi:hypothetical protein